MDHPIRIPKPHITSRPRITQGYLEGQLLVATPQVNGDFFEQAVIYLFAHNGEGAMGLIINKPLERVHFSEVASQLGIDAPRELPDLPIHHGGPVEEQRGFLLHSDEYEGEATLRGTHGLSVTASTTILQDIVKGKGPRRSLMMLGYAGWSPGQLENELEHNSWICVPATPALVFHDDNEAKWALSAKSLGVDMGRFSPSVGHA